MFITDARGTSCVIASDPDILAAMSTPTKSLEMRRVLSVCTLFTFSLFFFSPLLVECLVFILRWHLFHKENIIDYSLITSSSPHIPRPIDFLSFSFKSRKYEPFVLIVCPLFIVIVCVLVDNTDLN